MSLAPHPFWLDGGYDRDVVEACRYHPTHRWITVRLGDVLVPGACRNPESRFTFCAACYVPRCGYTTDEKTPEGRCIHPRHHPEPHYFEWSHRSEPVGGVAA